MDRKLTDGRCQEANNVGARCHPDGDQPCMSSAVYIFLDYVNKKVRQIAVIVSQKNRDICVENLKIKLYSILNIIQNCCFYYKAIALHFEIIFVYNRYQNIYSISIHKM